jgi:hypothetical protein
MFVRFKKRKSDGRRPSGTDDAKLACVGGCADRRGQRLGGGMRAGKGCPMKPRCRWLIAGKLVPYRLLVALIVNRRVDGKVRQEHIADLGSIDEYMLPGFYPDGAPSDEQWHRGSVQARRQFWLGAFEKLERLGNRVSAEHREAFIEEMMRRIPIPTSEERRTADLFEWKHLALSMQTMNHQTKKMIKSSEQARARIDQNLAGLRQEDDRETATMARAQTEVLKRLSRR